VQSIILSVLLITALIVYLSKMGKPGYPATHGSIVELNTEIAPVTLCHAQGEQEASEKSSDWGGGAERRSILTFVSQ
jgi:hypothetical protein